MLQPVASGHRFLAWRRPVFNSDEDPPDRTSGVSLFVTVVVVIAILVLMLTLVLQMSSTP